ncbi:KxYKxGKxW signal peptide domain-containing protein [Limosilactobacillus reuteri]|uniref:KxYKxGKxW signal peptide domain-containing protein n=1 Tax=Limosilactobacillus reuteri TaxID=1598 RepID=UPI00143DF952|nr:KxYKxGKxW signal peptide domain-containing protein [Limosilactobacillus reuteri]QIZ04754.1 KxYKxGKxW signal peptide domain-containing protein [Limosilactobacillus reuteri]
MEIKKHYKLYKNGKQWCCMALAVAAVSAGLVLGNTNVKADTPTDNVPVVKTTNPTTGDANAELFLGVITSYQERFPVYIKTG